MDKTAGVEEVQAGTFPEVMDFALVAEYLRIKPQSARSMVSRRVLPFTKCGKRTLFLKSQIDAWLLKNSVKPIQA